MKPASSFEFPDEQQEAMGKAKRLAWITIAYLSSVVLIMSTVLGNSQAMKAVWAEDLLSLIPAISFLVSAHLAAKPPSERYPYGYHRVVSISFLVASLALCAMGLFLLFESVTTLIKQEHPTVGSIEVFGHVIWLGWLALPVLVYSGLPAVFLGRMKKPLAKKIHDKTLYADATMNADDWLTAAAGFVGMIGIGLGWWWADPIAAGVISLSVCRDGWRNLSNVVSDLMDSTPKSVDHKEEDPLPRQVHDYLCGLDWVEDAEVRFREDGHVYFGEGFVVAEDQQDLTIRIHEAVEGAKKIDWKVYELVITPVSHLDRGKDPNPDYGH